MLWHKLYLKYAVWHVWGAFMPNYQQNVGNQPAGGLSDLSDRLAEAERGRFISADSIEEWVGSWLTPDELPPPEPDLHLSRLD